VITLCERQIWADPCLNTWRVVTVYAKGNVLLTRGVKTMGGFGPTMLDAPRGWTCVYDPQGLNRDAPCPAMLRRLHRPCSSFRRSG
jgi:hypothetical protein